MINLTNIKSIGGAALISAVFVFGFAASQAQANTSNRILNCKGASKLVVMDCCESEIRKNGNKRPYWMQQAHTSCREMTISCVKYSRGGNGAKRCYVKNDDYNTNDNDRQTRDNNRDNNDNDNGHGGDNGQKD